MKQEAGIVERQLVTAGQVTTEQPVPRARETDPTVVADLGHHRGPVLGHHGHVIGQEMEASALRDVLRALTDQRLVPPRRRPVLLTHRTGTPTTGLASHRRPHQQGSTRTLGRVRQLPSTARRPNDVEIMMNAATACVVTTAPLTTAMIRSLWRMYQSCALACRDHLHPRPPILRCHLSQHCPKVCPHWPSCSRYCHPW